MSTPLVVPFPNASVVQDPSAGRYMSVPTPTDMRRRTLFGIPLRSQFTGQEVDDPTLQDYINQSISEVEHELDLYITPVQFRERQDYNREMNFWSYGYIKLNHSPILTVDRYMLTFNNGLPTSPPLVDIPLEFIHVQSQEGTVQLVPAFGVTVSGYIASIYSGLGFHAFNSQVISQWPGAVDVTYTVGFPIGQVPALLAGLVENLAAFKFLSSLGPILFPFNSIGISIDGVSQSTGTAGPMFLQSRLADLDKTIQQQKEVARGAYQKRFLIDYL